MGQALPEILARGAARQLYRLLRISAPLLRPIYQHIGLENRARAVTALLRIGCGTVTPAFVKESEIVAPARLSPGVACIGHPAADQALAKRFAPRPARNDAAPARNNGEALGQEAVPTPRHRLREDEADVVRLKQRAEPGLRLHKWPSIAQGYS
jgi:hypothetical protein